MAFDIATSGYAVRPAAAGDRRALRMLLPEIRDVALAFVATDGERHLVIAAAAVTASMRTKPLPGPGISLHVIEPCRGHGVATQLFAHLLPAARTAGAEALYASKRVDVGSDEMRAWQRLGFSPCEVVEEHLLPIDQFESRLRPLVERLRRQGHIPTNARVIPLYQANLAAVLQLHLDHMGGDRAEIYRKLRSRGAGSYLPRESKVLLVDDQVKGCVLGRRVSKQTIVIDANIVDPELRGGWANAWLKLEAFRSRPTGLAEFQFTSFDHYTDTRSFAKKLGGRTIRTTALMIRRLEP